MVKRFTASGSGRAAMARAGRAFAGMALAAAALVGAPVPAQEEPNFWHDDDWAVMPMYLDHRTYCAAHLRPREAGVALYLGYRQRSGQVFILLEVPNEDLGALPHSGTIDAQVVLFDPRQPEETVKARVRFDYVRKAGAAHLRSELTGSDAQAFLQGVATHGPILGFVRRVKAAAAAGEKSGAEAAGTRPVWLYKAHLRSASAAMAKLHECASLYTL